VRATCEDQAPAQPVLSTPILLPAPLWARPDPGQQGARTGREAGGGGGGRGTAAAASAHQHRPPAPPAPPSHTLPRIARQSCQQRADGGGVRLVVRAIARLRARRHGVGRRQTTTDGRDGEGRAGEGRGGAPWATGGRVTSRCAHVDAPHRPRVCAVACHDGQGGETRGGAARCGAPTRVTVRRFCWPVARRSLARRSGGRREGGPTAAPQAADSASVCSCIADTTYTPPDAGRATARRNTGRPTAVPTAPHASGSPLQHPLPSGATLTRSAAHSPRSTRPWCARACPPPAPPAHAPRPPPPSPRRRAGACSCSGRPG
jgi:hypothetical protein